MTSTRLLSGALLAALALSTAGCHRETTRAYNPPPPPTIAAGSSSRPTRRNPAPETEPSTPVPAQIPKSYGRPIATQVGLASWYGPPYAGRKSADGKVYNQYAMTAAHLTLPLGTIVRVTNLSNNESAIVRITDRGPFVHGRIIDLSLAAAKATGIYRAGVAKVRIEAYAPPGHATADPAGHWCVQVGAYSREKSAVKLKQELQRRYTTARVIEFSGPTGYWVRINPHWPSKAEADEVAAGIHPRDPDAHPYLIRTN